MDRYFQDITIKYQDRRGEVVTGIREVHILHVDFSSESFIRFHVIDYNKHEEVICIPKLRFLSITID